MNRAMGGRQRYFELAGFYVMNFKDAEGDLPRVEATVRVRADGLEEHPAATGHGRLLPRPRHQKDPGALLPAAQRGAPGRLQGAYTQRRRRHQAADAGLDRVPRRRLHLESHGGAPSTC
ncbi:hypothetical protein DFAR_570004 [Desulfarculales bacterium]